MKFYIPAILMMFACSTVTAGTIAGTVRAEGKAGTDKGFPIVGYGNFSDYFFTDLSTELWRLSLGIGYRFSDQLVIKTEYSFELGREVGGDSRDHEDFFGTEAAFKF